MMGLAVFFGLAAFALGLVIGSFLNVCIYRFPREESLIYPPSHCPKCYQHIRGEDNIPVISWLLLRGRCRSCGLHISFVYPLVELATGCLFVFYYWRFVGSYLPPITMVPEGKFVLYYGALYMVHITFLCGLLVATVVDFKCFIIPDEISVGGTFFAVAASFIFHEIHASGLIAGHPRLSGLAASLIGAAVGAGLIYGIGAAGKAILGREAMGFGDVKLMAMIGALLGWQMTLFVLFFSAILGALYGTIHLALTGRSKIPYGPFLSIAAAVCLVFRGEVGLFLANIIRSYRFLIR